MKVTEYFLGFGPRLWSFRRGETEYGIKAFPLGGYVKIPGMTSLEEVDPEDEPRTYREKPFHARLLVAVAGSAMHFLMAFVLLWALLAFVGVPNDNQVGVQAVNTVGGQTGPAQAAGLRPGDVIVSVDGHAVSGNTHALTTAIPTTPGSRYRRRVPERPSPDAHGRPRQRADRARGRSGAAAGLGSLRCHRGDPGRPTHHPGPLDAVAATGTDLARLTWASMVGVGHLFSPNGVAQRFAQVTNAEAANQAAANGTRVESIVGAARTATQAAQAGIGDLLLILISINVFFGIFNLFPMLPLDGGHVAIAVYEKIRTGRRKVVYHADVTKLMPFTWLHVHVPRRAVRAPRCSPTSLHPMANPFADRRRPVGRRRCARARSMEAMERSAQILGVPPSEPTRQINVGDVPVGGRRPGLGAVDDDHQDGRRRRHPGPDLRPGRRRGRHRALHLQRGGGRRGPGPDRAPLAGAHHRRHPLPPEMALAALEAGVHGLRLNPGNLRKADEIKQVAAEAKDRGVPIRIGVNAGSLHPELYKRFGGATPEALVESARMELAYFAEVGSPT